MRGVAAVVILDDVGMAIRRVFLDRIVMKKDDVMMKAKDHHELAST